MYSVMVARYKYFPEVKTKGMSAAPRLVLFTSEYVSIPCFNTPDHVQHKDQKHSLCLPLGVLFYVVKWAKFDIIYFYRNLSVYLINKHFCFFVESLFNQKGRSCVGLWQRKRHPSQDRWEVLSQYCLISCTFLSRLFLSHRSLDVLFQGTCHTSRLRGQNPWSQTEGLKAH